MISKRLPAVFVLLAAAASGLMFAPVFGFSALLVPVLVVALACFVAAELSARVAALASWRPVIALLLGLLAVIETQLFPTTLSGLPTGTTLSALANGITKSWQLTLQSTWPARPDAALLLFVPLAVLVAGVLGIELLRWSAAALLPSLVVVGLSQAYVALTGITATLTGLVYAALGAGLLVVTRRRPATAPTSKRKTKMTLRSRMNAVLVAVPVLVLSVLAAVVVTGIDQGHQPAYSLHQNSSVPIPPTRITSPLDEIATRLEHPATPIFSYSTNDPVDRWRLAVLTDFNGANWSTAEQFRRMGVLARQPSSITVATKLESANVRLSGDVSGPWLPSQPVPATVSGLAPLLDPANGTLVDPGRTGQADYTVQWREPQPDDRTLNNAAIDPAATAGGGVGAVPPGITELAHQAVGGVRPTMQTALVLERYLQTHYQLATTNQLPTGNGWPQLRNFLLDTKRGTTEQFAASYVVLARILGIPARLAVGFRAPVQQTDGQFVVRNADVFAWPEVAAAGIGWVPLDPSGVSEQAGSPAKRQLAGGLAGATQKARANLPPQNKLQQPKLPPQPPAPERENPGGFSLPVLLVPILLILLGLALIAVLSIPLLRIVRMWRRRRETGVRGVLAAWWEARDRLRAHGVVCTAGMTVRDMAVAAGTLGDQSIVDALYDLALQVDAVLWSGAAPGSNAVDEAWTTVAPIRRALVKRGMGARIRAAFELSALRSPQQNTSNTPLSPIATS